jgi:hypothetical protein
MSGDVHVRFCERLGVRLPRATHLLLTGSTKALLAAEVTPGGERCLAERGFA